MPPITDEQKQKIISAVVSAVVTLIISVLAILGYNVYIVQPQQAAQSAAIDRADARHAQLLNELGFEPAPVPGEVGAQALNGGGWLCKAGSKPCIDARYGRDIVGYSNNGTTQKWKIEGTDGTFQHAGFDVLDASTTISPTNGGIITPTATLQPLSSAGTVTPTLAVTNTAGSAYTNNTLLVLYNTTDTTINLADSGNAKLSAAWAAGQYDTLWLRFDAASSTWIELARSNN